MKILGIETSCDETACAVVMNGTRVLSNVIYSQIPLHAKTGGIVPEVAAREHVLKIIPVIDEAMKKAGLVSRNGQPDFSEIDAIAVTKGPGLISSLLIGTTTASCLSLVKRKPVIPVNHIHAHIYANWLSVSHSQQASKFEPPEFPILVLTVSGGHNELFLMRGHSDFELIGETLDDAAGEAFDKVARLLQLGYPGGPTISKAAEKGFKDAFKLPRAYLGKGSFNFSFSGLKTAVLNLVKEQDRLTSKFVNDCAASFQEAICDALSERILFGIEKFYPREVHLAGGVSANKRLREMLTAKMQRMDSDRARKIVLRWPSRIEFCTDNAAMVASAGYFMMKGRKSGFFRPTNIVPEVEF